MKKLVGPFVIPAFLPIVSNKCFKIRHDIIYNCNNLKKGVSRIAMSDPAETEAEEDADQDSDQQKASKLMTFFFSYVKRIGDHLAALEFTIQTIVEKHYVHIQATGHDQATTQQDLNLCMVKIQDQANTLRLCIHAMHASNETYQKLYARFTSDVRIRNTQYATLSRKFFDLMNVYHNVQQHNKETHERIFITACRAVKPELTEEAVHHILASGLQNVFSGQDLEKAAATLNAIQERHDDILRLEQSLQELHELFLDMAILIQNQGDMIDGIEFNVLTTQEYVERTVKVTTETVRAVKSLRKKKMCIWFCCCLLVVFLSLAIVLGLLFTRPWN